MITKLVGKIQKLLPFRNPLLYNMSDDGKNKDSTRRSPFFRQIKSKVESEEPAAPKQNPFGKRMIKKQKEEKVETAP